MNNNAFVAVAGGPQRFQVSLLQLFDEIAETFLRVSRGGRAKGRAHASLQSYLDGKIAIGGAWYRRRAILLAVHDMKKNLEAPLALQRRTLAQLMSLDVQPLPQLKLYRDIATAILRMEVIVRATAIQAMENGEPEIVSPIVHVPYVVEAQLWLQSAALHLERAKDFIYSALSGLRVPKLQGLTVNWPVIARAIASASSTSQHLPQGQL